MLPSVLGGGALAAVIFYLLKHVTGLYRQLGQAQAARAEGAETEIAALRLRIATLELEVAEMRQDARDREAEWARRSAALVMVRRAHPEEAAKHRWVEARVEEILSGSDPHVA